MAFSTATDVFSRVVNTTISEYVKKEMANVMANQKLLSILKSKGLISRISGGTDSQWGVRHKRTPMRYFQDMPSLTFQRFNKRVNATLPPRGYYWTDQYTAMEEWMNRGPQAIINYIGSMATELMDDAKFQYAGELYKDGNATGATKGIHGLDSFVGISGAVSGNAKVGNPSDTYASISTALGSKGSWDTTTWPEGTGQVGYHFWSPLVLLPDAAGYGGASATWALQALRVFKYGSIHNDLRGYKVNMWLLHGAAYRQVSDLVETKENIYTERSPNNSLLVKLGFGDTLKYEGAEITYERDVPQLCRADTSVSQMGYGLNFDKGNIQIKHWSPELFYAYPMDFSLESTSKRLAIVSCHNLFCNPQAHVHLRRTSGTETW